MAKKPATPPDRLRQNRADAREEIDATVQEWADGKRHWAGTSALLASLLEDGHADAHALGREHAGEGGGVTSEDEAAGAAAWAGEQTYWDGLNTDVEAGKYGTPGSEDNPANVDGLSGRVDNFTGKWAETANTSWTATEDPGTQFEWILDDSNPCPDCEELAAGSPYTADTLPTQPGACDTQCLYNCRCYLVTLDGKEGFTA